MKKSKEMKSDSKNKHLIDDRSLPEQLLELKKVYKASIKTIEKVEEIFLQGDYRYTDPFENIILAGFIDNEAIKVDKIEEDIPKKTNQEEINKIKGPQKIFKFYAKRIAEEKGFTIKEYEPSVSGGKADILAIKDDKNLIIECCSCRLSKLINYLSKSNTILWVLIRRFSNNKVTIFQFSRGKNWNKYNLKHKAYTDDKMSYYYEKISKFF